MSISNQSEESGTPATPSAGRQLIYPKAAGWFTKNSAGVEEQISGASKNTRPTIRASNSGAQAISAAAQTVVNLATEIFDTNNNFVSNRFTPTIAGKYLIITAIHYVPSVNTQAIGSIYKNGTVVDYCIGMGLSTNQNSLNVSTVIDMNGTTDYIEAYVWTAVSSTVQNASLSACRVD